MSELRKSILAGMAIGLGCIAFVSVENRYMGAFLFSIGLLTICGMEWSLFTGKLCRCRNSVLDMIKIWVGNLVGSVVMAAGYYGACGKMESAAAVITAKLQKPPLAAFISGMLCEMCIYIAVIGYREVKSDIGKYLAIILGVMVFILAGFEHCVADMFYIAASGHFVHTYGFLFLLLVTAGNITGAFVMNVMDKRRGGE